MMITINRRQSVIHHYQSSVIIVIIIIIIKQRILFTTFINVNRRSLFECLHSYWSIKQRLKALNYAWQQCLATLGFSDYSYMQFWNECSSQ